MEDAPHRQPHLPPPFSAASSPPSLPQGSESPPPAATASTLQERSAGRQQGCSSSSTRSTFPLLGSCATAAAQVRSMGTKGTSTRTHLECSSI